MTISYSVEEHGCSVHTFYKRVKGYRETILLVRDHCGGLFGAFASAEWHVAQGYYGSGEAFLFRLRPSWIVHTWSGRNTYFMLSNDSSLALGGGGHFGLWLGEDFAQGSSGASQTFDSQCLSADDEFKCIAVEVYGLVSSTADGVDDEF